MPILLLLTLVMITGNNDPSVVQNFLYRIQTEFMQIERFQKIKDHPEILVDMFSCLRVLK